jgi:2-dehydro-3-deoxyphosphogluconate aldolase/(4S)-4-hydroxy-2-oxoglutarate aldolase
MHKGNIVLKRIIDQGVIPRYFHADVNVSIEVLKAFYRAGMRAVEYTNLGEAALANFLHLRKIADSELPGLLLGAGTIKDKIAATEYVNEGADFIVSPYVVKDVASIVHTNDLLWIPTCMGPTEILHAQDLGAPLVKLYPATTLGPAYVSDMKEIFPDLFFWPTGDVEASEQGLGAWFQAGASVISLGKNFLPVDLISSTDYATIESNTRDALGTVSDVKKG